VLRRVPAIGAIIGGGRVAPVLSSLPLDGASRVSLPD
jgi:hypothetical protein